LRSGTGRQDQPGTNEGQEKGANHRQAPFAPPIAKVSWLEA
jgi:hypothetical protein